MMEKELEVIELTQSNIESMIYVIRGQKVMLDFDLAKIYGYETKYLNRQVQRNIEKFPEDFMFQLSEAESEKILWCQNVTLNKIGNKQGMHLKYNPYAFTEQGIYMLMTVLKGELATKQSIALIKAFKQMKDYIVSSNEISNANELIKLTKTVGKHDREIKGMKNQLKEVMNNFIDPSTYKHFLILNGEKIEAGMAYQQIYGLAKKRVFVIDDYIGLKTLSLLKAINQNIEVTIFSDNVSKDGLDASMINDFISETGIKVTLKPSDNVFHDRYIVIDYECENEMIFHAGSSSKDTGNKVTTIMLVDRPDLYHSLIDSLTK